MSLLDDVSIVVTPNGYKAGELYAVVPVPTEGAELVTNGDFSADASWSKGAGWTISSGKASSDGSQSGNSELKQQNGVAGVSLDLQVGKQYKMVIDITVSTGAITYIEVAGNTNSNDINATGVSTLYFSPTSTNDRITIAANSTFVGSVNSVSVKEYTAADMDVTRATAATRVDEAGLVNYAEIVSDTELVTNGNFANGTTDWSANANATLSIDTGRLKIAISGAGSGYAHQTFTIESGKQYKCTGTIDFGTASQMRFYVSNPGQFFNITQSGNFNFTFTSTGTSTQVRLYTYGDGNYGFWDNISVKEVTRDNVPRIDYSGGGCPHILAEPQRTNLLTYSEDFSNAIYIKDSTVSVGTTNNVSPSGESNATKIDVTASGRIYSNVTTDTYVSSIFIKAGTFAYFKLAGVQVDLVAETNANGTIESLGNGWFKVGVNYTGNRPFQIQAYPDGSYATHTTLGNYFIWGAQIEAGSYATSYIPTSGSTVTRNKDQFTRDGIGSLINSTEGTLFVELENITGTDATNKMISITDGSLTNKISLFVSSNQISVESAGSGTNLGIYSKALQSGFNKIAVKYKVNDCAMWVNGTEYTDTSFAAFSSSTLNALVFDRGDGTQNLFGKVKQLQVYKTALTDAQLTSLTS